jgi:hypothetical protein
MANHPPGGPARHLTFLCDRSLVGRIIGKQGVTIRGLQLYTNVVIDIDQRRDPSQIVFSAESPDAIALAICMVSDMLSGAFKGFALLREMQGANSGTPRPIYLPGRGLVPLRQTTMLRESPAAHHSCRITPSLHYAPSGLLGTDLSTTLSSARL